MIKEICVLGEVTKIKIVDSLTNEYGHPLLGQYDQKNRLIYIRKDTARNMRLTLIHELIHGVMARTGLNQVISAELQEIVCESISNTIDENFNLRKTKRK